MRDEKQLWLVNALTGDEMDGYPCILRNNTVDLTDELTFPSGQEVIQSLMSVGEPIDQREK